MGTAGLALIKRRINSIENTKKITKAMALVATSKLKKVRKNLNHALVYNENIKEIFDKVIGQLPEEYESIYLDNKSNGKKLYIILGSDMGLCGGFNSNIALYIKEKVEDKDDISIVTIGLRCQSYLKRYKIPCIKQYSDIKDIPTNKEIDQIYEFALDMYKNKEISEIKIIYTEFISPLKQNIREITLLPIKMREYKELDCLVDPSVEEVFENYIDIYMKSELIKAMISSKVSEYSSRRVAMENATESADDILKNLNIKFNRIRQGIITQEIAEIVGGTEFKR